MSWSVSFIGKPANVANALEAHSSGLSDQSKAEYDEALPYLIGLVNQNFVKPEAGREEPAIKINAKGSGTTNQRVPVQRECSVCIESNYTKLV